MSNHRECKTPEVIYMTDSRPSTLNSQGLAKILEHQRAAYQKALAAEMREQGGAA